MGVFVRMVFSDWVERGDSFMGLLFGFGFCFKSLVDLIQVFERVGIVGGVL